MHVEFVVTLGNVLITENTENMIITVIDIRGYKSIQYITINGAINCFSHFTIIHVPTWLLLLVT